MSVVGDEKPRKDPQTTINEFWEGLITKEPGKVTNIFPHSLYANLLPPRPKEGPAKGKNAAESYEAAAAECRARVKRIVRECNRTNEKFTDADFDIEGDLGIGNCLRSLLSSYDDFQAAENAGPVSSSDLQDCLSTLVDANIFGTNLVALDINALNRTLNGSKPVGGDGPSTVHRIDWIFENPSFTLDGFSSSDVRQGANGDCWFIAAVATLCSNPTLMDKVCVARDEECGVYGFVLHRDGEWFSTVVDDNLYLTSSDFDAFGDYYDASGEKERKHRKNRQTGSEALYFAKCADPNETWLPLLEKAYAKVHGDYKAIEGGISGEGVEDLTGGVTTKVMTNRILSKERLWKELLEVNKQFLFAASSPSIGTDSEARRGLALGHAYSVLKAVEEEGEDGKKVRLVLIRNPWGKRSYNGIGEWNGPWSDGSKEWTPYWLKKLDHKFGDDGMFWMSYEDLRSRFDLLDRTRLFDKEWTVVQHWTSVSVSWVTGYLNLKFSVEIKEAGPTVFVLSQLDDRYFRGLEGQYDFDLHFLLQEENAPTGDHIVRARGAWFGNRSISAEVDLEPGRYEIVPKIVANRDANKQEVQDVVTEWAEKNPQKLRQIGMNYDIANAKGIVELTEEEKRAKEKKEKEKKEKEKAEKAKEEKEKEVFVQWKKEKEQRLKAESEKDKKDVKADEKKDDTAEKKDEKADEPEPAKVKTETSEDKKDDKPEVRKETQDATKAESSDSDITKTEPSNEAPKDNSSASEPKDTPTSSDDDVNPSAPSGPAYGAGFNADGPSYEGDVAPQPAANPPASTDKETKPWNAVCVMGLRVYSKDPEVSIKLKKPKDAEEGASLDVDGKTAAGATM